MQTNQWTDLLTDMKGTKCYFLLDSSLRMRWMCTNNLRESITQWKTLQLKKYCIGQGRRSGVRSNIRSCGIHSGRSGIVSGFSKYFVRMMSRNGSVGIATGWVSGVRLPTAVKYLSPPHRVQTGTGCPPSLYQMGTGGSFPGAKEARASSYHALPHLPNTRIM
jgi:hypothetical protein